MSDKTLSKINKEQTRILTAINKVRNDTLALNPNTKSYTLAKQAIGLIHKHHIQITLAVKKDIIKLSKQDDSSFNNETMLNVISMAYINYMMNEYSVYQNKYRKELSFDKQNMATDK